MGLFINYVTQILGFLTASILAIIECKLQKDSKSMSYKYLKVLNPNSNFNRKMNLHKLPVTIFAHT